MGPKSSKFGMIITSFFETRGDDCRYPRTYKKPMVVARSIPILAAWLEKNNEKHMISLFFSDGKHVKRTCLVHEI